MNAILTVRLTIQDGDPLDLEHILREAVGQGRPEEALIEILDALESRQLSSDDVVLEDIEFEDG